MTFSNQRKQLMNKGFLYCGCRPGSCNLRNCFRDRAISAASPTSNATGGSSAQPRAIERQEGSWARKLIDRRKLERSAHPDRQPNAL